MPPNASDIPLADIPLDDFLVRESVPVIEPRGFRDYDARWRYPEEINLLGVQRFGLGLGAFLREQASKTSDAAPQRIVIGRDFRGYSLAIQQALALGLVSAGMEVLDIGLGLSPTAYFARNALEADAVAMVTASHNPNGWTGFKMGAAHPLTFGPGEMARLRDITLEDGCSPHPGGIYRRVEGIQEKYLDDLAARPGFTRGLRLVAACGNGTAGIFAPQLLRRLGARVIAMDCEPDPSFPNHEPNPEHFDMLEALREMVLQEGADFGLAFDGDGDRCGVIDERGRVLFADKIGLLMARSLASHNEGAHFIVDSKTTGIFERDAVLRQHGASVEYYKTGHSHMKRRMAETRALAGFEKSGHFFFAEPIGHGYDDAMLAAVLLCELLCRGEKTLGELYDGLEKSFVSPTMGAYCPDERKHAVIEAVTKEYAGLARRDGSIAGRKIVETIEVDGIRFVLDDGSWGLVRASSNKPSLVVVVESLASHEDMKAIFTDIDTRMRQFDEVGDYDQDLDAASA
ncbi:MAG: phosphomannomutase/phosphoglucomutase, partial [Hyphomicrobiales bacterium]|nr:phosphomannomutase/phosphoglucomutase [Hyphomicrobiales bacterium]